MACVFWQDEYETTTKEIMKKLNYEDVTKMILKECEDKDGCKGGGYDHDISSPMKNFKDQ